MISNSNDRFQHTVVLAILADPRAAIGDFHRPVPAVGYWPEANAEHEVNRAMSLFIMYTLEQRIISSASLRLGVHLFPVPFLSFE